MASALQHYQVCDRAKHGKVPASVDDIASVSHACRVSGKCGMNGRNTSTAGVWLTMFESAPANMLMTPGRSGRNRAAIAKRSAEGEVSLLRRTTMNRPINNGCGADDVRYHGHGQQIRDGIAAQ